MFTRKTVVDETHIGKSTNVCKLIVGTDASQICPYSTCKPMPTEFFTRYEFDADSQRSKPRQNQSRRLENVVMSYFQRKRPDCRIENVYTAGTQKKIDCSNAGGFCGLGNTLFEAMGCFFLRSFCEEARSALFREDFQIGIRKREINEMRKQYIEEKGCNAVEMWECEWWKLYKTYVSVKEHLREHFPYKRPLLQEQFLDKIKSGELFGYLQCDINVPEHLRRPICQFSANFQKVILCRYHCGLLMQEYAVCQEGRNNVPTAANVNF